MKGQISTTMSAPRSRTVSNASSSLDDYMHNDKAASSDDKSVGSYDDQSDIEALNARFGKKSDKDTSDSFHPRSSVISVGDYNSMHDRKSDGGDRSASDEGGGTGGGVIDKRESADVFRIKLIVFLVLFVSAIVVAESLWLYINQSEEAIFLKSFDGDAEKVLSYIGLNIDRMHGVLDGVATQIITVAALTNQSWPYVTVPAFADLASKALPLAEAVVLNVLPVVTAAQREQWEEYTASASHTEWMSESLLVQSQWGGFVGSNNNADWDEKDRQEHVDKAIQPSIHYRNGSVVPEKKRKGDVHLPIWQNFPVAVNENTTAYNWDWMTMLSTNQSDALLKRRQSILREPHMIAKKTDTAAMEEQEWFKGYLSNFVPAEQLDEPVSEFLFPMVQKQQHHGDGGHVGNGNNTSKLVGLLSTTIYWHNLLQDILPVDSKGVYVVVTNPCTLAFTFEINGHDVTYIGLGDKSERPYEDRVKAQSLEALLPNANANANTATAHASKYSNVEMDHSHCPLTIEVYPSKKMKATFATNNAVIFAVATICIFAFTSLVFYIYDKKVENRQRRVVATAVRSNAIVSSLFPSAVRDRLYPVTAAAASSKKTAKGKRAYLRSEVGNNSMDGSGDGEDGDGKNHADPNSGSPIAELYPETTVLFADIVGFTAWSSVRQPTQVFQMLESVYSAFDAIAKQRGVFKVETIGDTYVAVVGLPTPRRNHAIVMARFAVDCRAKMRKITEELSNTLGPGTADLCMRFGLNSGPTTGGVLRGEKSRFQLFGDTVNTAARMESNGEKNKIQVSQKTADLIRLAGKGHWLTARPNPINCKGKGLMTTYWCEPRSGAQSTVSTSDTSLTPPESEPEEPGPAQSQQHLIDWNVTVFTELLKKVVAHRASSAGRKVTPQPRRVGARNPLDEVMEVLSLPEPASDASKAAPATNELSANVQAQLKDLVTTIASLYRNNPFHNFDHCSHVAMSTKKLLDRIEEHGSRTSQIITADPITNFAIVFAALIHDLDHPGVSNAQLVDEQTTAAVKYAGKSVAEQNSVDQTWDLLMQSKYADLRSCLCTTMAEFQQFRQIIVNVVMATDLFDKDLKAMREARWEKSFCKGVVASSLRAEQALDTVDDNRRATIIIELIIQASDVSHTMQHFTVYKKWNMCLLEEMYKAYASGRTTKDPLEGWYDGELWFFDNYVIPLAQKLRECGVFGVSFDEFLDYAKDNRLEWELKGRDIVRDAAYRLLTSSSAIK